jgi:DNA polymerase IIIc chi subunit
MIMLWGCFAASGTQGPITKSVSLLKVVDIPEEQKPKHTSKAPWKGYRRKNWTVLEWRQKTTVGSGHPSNIEEL